MKSVDLIAAAELIKRAEALRDMGATKAAMEQPRSGVQKNPDMLRANFLREHPYQEFLEEALKEMEAVAELIAVKGHAG